MQLKRARTRFGCARRVFSCPRAAGFKQQLAGAAYKSRLKRWPSVFAPHRTPRSEAPGSGETTMTRHTRDGRRGHIVPFPQSPVPRPAASEARGNATAEVVDLSWQQMLSAIHEEMELGLVLQCSYEPWRVNRFIERRRARNARREA